MSSGFTAKPLALGRLLSDPYTFQIPSFQRPFSWTTREAGQLLDDLTLALQEANGDSEGGGYFLGTILLLEPSPTVPPRGVRGTPPRHSVIDGQQRLATLTILLAVLRDILKERGMALPAMLEERIVCRQDGKFESCYRLELRGREGDFFKRCVQDGEAAQDDDLTDAERRILSVRQDLAAELAERSTGELVGLVEFIARGCHVAVITAHGIDQAHRIFSVLNDRGRPLARNDILKAQVLGQVDRQTQQSALAIWESLAARLGDDFETLFSHIRAVEAGPKSQVISGIRELIAGAGGAGSFVTQFLEPYGNALYAIREARHSGSQHSPEISRFLGYLGWFGSADWIPPALLWWRVHNGDPEKLLVFLRKLERLAYALRLLGIGADKRLARFQAVVQAIRKGTALDAGHSPLEISREEQRNILYNLRRLHARSQLTCKLVLLRLNDELAGAAQNLAPGDFTVEHVLPQKPGRNSAWRAWFPSADERETCTNSIGNLVLVTRQQNDRARNAELPRKLEVYFRTPGVKAPRITGELEGISEWRAPQILAREDRLLTLLRSMWQLESSKSSELPLQGKDGTRQWARRSPRIAAG